MKELNNKMAKRRN